MQDILKQNNVALCYEIEKLQRSLRDAQVNITEELEPYAAWIINECENFHRSVLQNIRYLEFGQGNLLKDILSNTQNVANAFYILNQHQASPILRARVSDRLPLKLLLWLHTTHCQTKGIPAAVGDGEFSIWAIRPSIYYTPCTAQYGLLNLPLFFHEFGHLLHKCYQPEIDALIDELQVEIGHHLLPPVERDDAYTQTQERSRNAIVAIWYEWAKEFFCDAVGFTIGGASFAYAFSMYLRILGRDQYHVSKEELARSSHPVTWIRIHLLADRARLMGYQEVATDLEERWNQVAAALGVMEDYYGFYAPKFLSVIQGKLDDMLTEAAPRKFQASEVSNREEESAFTSPVALLNAAWQKFQDDPENYREWEKEAIARFLDADI